MRKGSISIPLKISLGYWLFGTAYIILSDSALGASEPVLGLSLLKGVVFVCVTAVLWYFLMKRYLKRSDSYQQRLDTVVNHTSDLLWMVDSNYLFVMANRKLCMELGEKSNGELLGRCASEFTTKDEFLATWKPKYDRAFRGETVRFLHKAEPPNEAHQFDFSLYPVKGKNGKIDRVVCFGHDVSALKQVQSALERQNSALKEIAWMQSHEVRKPLANIMGLISAIDGDAVDNPELKDILNHIKSESMEFDVIIRRIVDQTLEGASGIDEDRNSILEEDSERG